MNGYEVDPLLVAFNSSITCLILIHFLICFLMFRDGVSESQFKQVLDIELNQIKKVTCNTPFVQFYYRLVAVFLKVLYVAPSMYLDSVYFTL